MHSTKVYFLHDFVLKMEQIASKAPEQHPHCQIQQSDVRQLTQTAWLLSNPMLAYGNVTRGLSTPTGRIFSFTGLHSSFPGIQNLVGSKARTASHIEGGT